MSDPLENALHRVSRVPGVTGALVVDAEAGVPVIADLREGVEGGAVAALAAALYRRTASATRAAGLGTLDSFHLEAEAGHVVAAGSGDLLVVAIVGDDAQLGLVRVETLQAARMLDGRLDAQ